MSSRRKSSAKPAGRLNLKGVATSIDRAEPLRSRRTCPQTECVTVVMESVYWPVPGGAWR